MLPPPPIAASSAGDPTAPPRPWTPSPSAPDGAVPPPVRAADGRPYAASPTGARDANHHHHHVPPPPPPPPPPRLPASQPYAAHPPVHAYGPPHAYHAAPPAHSGAHGGHWPMTTAASPPAASAAPLAMAAPGPAAGSMPPTSGGGYGARGPVPMPLRATPPPLPVPLPIPRPVASAPAASPSAPAGAPYHRPPSLYHPPHPPSHHGAHPHHPPLPPTHHGYLPHGLASPDPASRAAPPPTPPPAPIPLAHPPAPIPRGHALARPSAASATSPSAHAPAAAPPAGAATGADADAVTAPPNGSKKPLLLFRKGARAGQPRANPFSALASLDQAAGPPAAGSAATSSAATGAAGAARPALARTASGGARSRLRMDQIPEAVAARIMPSFSTRPFPPPAAGAAAVAAAATATPHAPRHGEPAAARRGGGGGGGGEVTNPSRLFQVLQKKRQDRADFTPETHRALLKLLTQSAPPSAAAAAAAKRPLEPDAAARPGVAVKRRAPAAAAAAAPDDGLAPAKGGSPGSPRHSQGLANSPPRRPRGLSSADGAPAAATAPAATVPSSMSLHEILQADYSVRTHLTFTTTTSGPVDLALPFATSAATAAAAARPTDASLAWFQFPLARPAPASTAIMTGVFEKLDRGDPLKPYEQTELDYFREQAALFQGALSHAVTQFLHFSVASNKPPPKPIYYINQTFAALFYYDLGSTATLAMSARPIVRLGPMSPGLVGRLLESGVPVHASPSCDAATLPRDADATRAARIVFVQGRDATRALLAFLLSWRDPRLTRHMAGPPTLIAGKPFLHASVVQAALARSAPRRFLGARDSATTGAAATAAAAVDAVATADDGGTAPAAAAAARHETVHTLELAGYFTPAAVQSLCETVSRAHPDVTVHLRSHRVSRGLNPLQALRKSGDPGAAAHPAPSTRASRVDETLAAVYFRGGRPVRTAAVAESAEWD
ncbi:hypothetical protein CXG81DRAFT_17655 [Caulochytrium protostelioides]|uniref:Uncharacterized protein n=1 Tax=Caulochytrium protostelioides TaxID=1555241 RepID=A0A4P9XBD4_9FUNG|nr:hypothetical protein CXG81DRAFT_17655 [Caulochytrium protostelioides]|eukprot:RKP02685.1 hypothetical protein CXG81DRAFT_17655 [Caulochytrium protostelioides]